jgi:hypothetical protein
MLVIAPSDDPGAVLHACRYDTRGSHSVMPRGERPNVLYFRTFDALGNVRSANKKNWCLPHWLPSRAEKAEHTQQFQRTPSSEKHDFIRKNR